MSDFDAFARKMRAERLPRRAIEAFGHYYRKLRSGQTGILREDEIEPVREIPEREDLPEPGPEARDALAAAVVVKLNGGLGTSMGMTRAKSLLEARRGLSFLDLIARQVLVLRKRHDCALPLVLMDSFRTREDSLAALRAHPGLDVGLPLDFLQHKVPRVAVDGLAPAEWPENPEYEWCPPGHGDLYTALVTSGTLEALRSRGIRWAMVSNSDNLGATLDLRILAWLASEQIPFLMEVTRRLPADRKGGHLARRRADGRLVLRESAQCADEDEEAFQDVERHRYFNTNNVWLDLDALARVMEADDGVLDLPMIRNEKTLDPQRPDSPRVYQLETAMGAAISVFEGAHALAVSRDRFTPVKTTNDLLAFRSDVYQLLDDFRVVRAPEAPPEQRIDLDPAFYRTVDDFELRFPSGAPSLIECTLLRVRGDVRFGAGVRVRGAVEIEHAGPEPLRVEDGAELS